MSKLDPNVPMKSRRNFLAGLAATPVLNLIGKNSVSAQAITGGGTTSAPLYLPGPKSKKFVAMQIGARSFVDEGVDKCLDTLQETGGVNVVMPTVFTYGTGLAGRQVHGQPLPDHGVKEYDQIHGGSYAKVHSEFYNDSVVKDIRAPELGNFDILAEVIPRAKAKGMQTYALFEEAYNPRLIPNFEKISEVDVYGKPGRSTCFNNPYARSFLASMVSDWMTNNDLDGLMWESERQGPLNNALGAHFGNFSVRRSSISCFCDHCVRKAKDHGIDGARSRDGFIALDHWVTKTVSQPRTTDGSFVSLWRIFLEFPEILAWERFWYTSQEEVYALIYGTAKAISPRAQVGWHIMHLVTMSPFYSADTSYARLAHVSDYIKPSPYNNCAGPRLAQYIRNVQSTIFRDLSPEQAADALQDDGLAG